MAVGGTYLHSVAQFKPEQRAAVAECYVPGRRSVMAVSWTAVVAGAPRPVAVADAVTAATVLPPALLLLTLAAAAVLTMVVDREAAAALADVHGDVVRVGLVTAGPREARRQTQYLVAKRRKKLRCKFSVVHNFNIGIFISAAFQFQCFAVLMTNRIPLQLAVSGRPRGAAGTPSANSSSVILNFDLRPRSSDLDVFASQTHALPTALPGPLTCSVTDGRKLHAMKSQVHRTGTSHPRRTRIRVRVGVRMRVGSGLRLGLVSGLGFKYSFCQQFMRALMTAIWSSE